LLWTFFLTLPTQAPLLALFIAHSKPKIQVFFKDFQTPNFAVREHQIIDEKPHRRLGSSTFRLPCDTEVYCIHNTLLRKKAERLISSNCLCYKFMIKCKFLHIAVNNWRTFQIFKHFQGRYVFSSISQAHYEPCFSSLVPMRTTVNDCSWNKTI